MGLWSTLKGVIAALSPWADRSLGALGEREAVKLLKAGGYAILGVNLRFGGNAEGHGAWGEIDILAQDPDGRTIVVVEVKARRRAAHAAGASAAVAPEASVTRSKSRKLIRLMDAVVAANGWQARPKRIDVVAVEFVERTPDPDEVRVKHFVGAVRRER